MVFLGELRASAGGVPGSSVQGSRCQPEQFPADRAGHPKVNARRRIQPPQRAGFGRLSSRNMIDEALNALPAGAFWGQNQAAARAAEIRAALHSVRLLIAPKLPLPEQ